MLRSKRSRAASVRSPSSSCSRLWPPRPTTPCPSARASCFPIWSDAPSARAAVVVASGARHRDSGARPAAVQTRTTRPTRDLYSARRARVLPDPARHRARLRGVRDVGVQWIAAVGAVGDARRRRRLRCELALLAPRRHAWPLALAHRRCAVGCRQRHRFRDRARCDPNPRPRPPLISRSASSPASASPASCTAIYNRAPARFP